MSNLRVNLLFSLLFVSLLIFLLPADNHHFHRRRRPHFSHSSSLLDPSPSPPTVAYFISGTDGDVSRITRLLHAVYHPRNYYLLHLDHRASDKQRRKLAETVVSVEAFAAVKNVNVVGRANAVSEEGSSSLASVLHGAAVLLRRWNDWDWFVNLDASDYPLIPQDDFLHVLSYVPKEFNFIEHTSKLNSTEYQRLKEIVVDPRLYLASKGKMFKGNRERSLPNAFRFFTGSSHVILSRKFAKFSIMGWDNFPRTLFLFFSNTKFSSRGYFQTLACNSNFSHTVINSNLRLRASNLNEMMSGAVFAMKFSPENPVLNAIDSILLHRKKGMVVAGGWCLDGSWGGDSCRDWGDPSVLRPGLAAKRFEKLLVKLMVGLNSRSGICNRR